MTNLTLNEQSNFIAQAYGRNSQEYKEFCEDNDLEFVEFHTYVDSESFEPDENFVAECAVIKAEAIIESFKNQDLFYYFYFHYHTDFNKGWYLDKNIQAWEELQACRNTTNIEWLIKEYEMWSKWEMKYEAKYVSEAY
jgi:hypothetical protein